MNNVILGTNGKLYVNGIRYAHIKSFELKATMNYEEIDVNGNLAKQYIYTGYALSGTMSLHKINSYNANLVKDGMKTGVMPDIKFVASVNDPNFDGQDRIEVEGVTFDEVTLLAFENGQIGSEDVPFKASGYNYIDIMD